MNRLSQQVAELADWIAHNEHFLWWLAASSLLIIIASLIVIPWLLVQIPADYFVDRGRRRSILVSLVGPHPFIIAVLRVVRNLIAVVLLTIGLLLLVLPGQGLLTILLGLVIADFPGKHRAVNWLVAQPSVCRPINWLRRKAGKEPIIYP